MEKDKERGGEAMKREAWKRSILHIKTMPMGRRGQQQECGSTLKLCAKLVPSIASSLLQYMY